jgi:hypothetical protein
LELWLKMAETLDGDREAMSIIPYPSSREIVLYIFSVLGIIGWN